MRDFDEVGALQMLARVRGVSPPVTRRLQIAEQTTLKQLHAALQVAFGWVDEHLYTFQIRGTPFGDPSRGIELALAGGVDVPLAAFGFEVGEAFRYEYNLFVPWQIDCRIEARSLISARRPIGCLGARGDPPDEEPGGPARYSEWFDSSSPGYAICELEDLVEEKPDAEEFCDRAREILDRARRAPPTRGRIETWLQ